MPAGDAIARSDPYRWTVCCRPYLTLASVVGAAGLSLLAAACGGGSPSVVANPGASTTANVGAGGSTAPGGELAEYANCMRSHNVPNFPDQPLTSSVSIKAEKSGINQISQSEALSPQFQAAQRTCAKYAPRGITPAQVSAAEMRKLLRVSRCMRSHGVPTFPDPDPITGELTTPAGLDKNSPQVLAALRTCSSLGQAAGLGVPNTGQ
jgi:hypothetical protein